MGLNELAIKFTENKYSSRADISKELGSSFVDNVWNSVIAYRKNYFHTLPLSAFNLNPFVICLCDNLNNTVTALDNNVSKLMEELEKLPNQNDYAKFISDRYVDLLTYVNSFKHMEVSINTLANIYNGNINVASESDLYFERYLSILKNIKNGVINTLNVDTLIEFASTLAGEEVSIRVKDDNNAANRILIDTIYTSAPAKHIPALLTNIINFINNSEDDIFVKASIAYYYISTIKPFDKFSDEVAVLTAKTIIALSTSNELGSIFPFEGVCIKSSDKLAKAFNNTQKYDDMTYVVLESLDSLNTGIGEFLDSLAIYKGRLMQNEFAQDDEVKVEEKVENIIKEEKVINEVVETKPEIVSKKENKPIVSPSEPSSNQIAFSYIPPQLDEKEAARLEEHLLELEPEMRKHEAHFYARHCTLGKKYTIDQYKKSIGCVYETARTSMEHLVSLGYYRKEQIKNKFVYVPIMRN